MWELNLLGICCIQILPLSSNMACSTTVWCSLPQVQRSQCDLLYHRQCAIVWQQLRDCNETWFVKMQGDGVDTLWTFFFTMFFFTTLCVAVLLLFRILCRCPRLGAYNGERVQWNFDLGFTNCCHLDVAAVAGLQVPLLPLEFARGLLCRSQLVDFESAFMLQNFCRHYFKRKKLLSGWLEWKHGWIALRHYLHTKSYKHLYPILSLLWVAWLSKICLLPPLSWCNCGLDTEMSWQANWFVFWFYHVLWLPDVFECVSEHLEMNEIMFFHCFTLYRPYLTGNQKIFQTCRFDHFPGGLNQGINLTNLPNSRRMCRWAWSNCARVSNSFGRCIPLKVVGGWSFHP